MSDNAELELCTKVSWYYYKENLTQVEIAEILKITRAKVIKLLDKARIEGIVQFNINGIETSYLEIKKKLLSLFNLENVIIVPKNPKEENLSNSLAKAAAQLIQNLVSENELLAVGWGEAVSNTLNHLYLDSNSHVSFVTLTGGVNNYLNTSELHRNWNLNGNFYAIPAPLITTSEEAAQQFLSEPSIQEILNLALIAKYAIVGIGGLSPDATFFKRNLLNNSERTFIKGKKGVGDILGQFYDINGTLLDLQIHKKLIGIPLSKLKNMKVIGIAGGDHKLDSILGALNGCYISTLVIDEETASHLIKLKEDFDAKLLFDS